MLLLLLLMLLLMPAIRLTVFDTVRLHGRHADHFLPRAFPSFRVAIRESVARSFGARARPLCRGRKKRTPDAKKSRDVAVTRGGCGGRRVSNGKLA